jgi:small subunit ribosomal protein S13e
MLWIIVSHWITHDFFYFEGVILRDSHGVAQVRFVSGNKILRIMKAMGLAPDLPEDLYYLIKKAVAIRKHLERNRYYRVI